MCFILLSYEKFSKFHSSMFYVFHYLQAAAIIFFQFSGIIPYCKKLEKKRLATKVE